MTDPVITCTDAETRGRYAARVDGVAEKGELTMSRLSATLIIADHTPVPDSMRGTGVADALAGRLIADARAAGPHIVPLCPFLRADTLRHREEMADVIQW